MREIDNWLTTDEAAELTGYSIVYIGRLAREDRIVARRKGHAWLIHKPSVLAFKARMDALGKAKFGLRPSEEVSAPQETPDESATPD